MQTQAPPPNTGPEGIPVAHARAVQRRPGRAARRERLAGLHDGRALGAHRLRHRARPLCGDLSTTTSRTSSPRSPRARAGAPSADPVFMSTIKTFRRLSRASSRRPSRTRSRSSAPTRTRAWRPGEAIAAAEIRRAAAAPAQRPVPGQGAEAGAADQGRRISQRVIADARLRLGGRAACPEAGALAVQSARPTVEPDMAEKKFELTNLATGKKSTAESRAARSARTCSNIANLTSDLGVFTFDPGFMATAACESKHHLHRRRRRRAAVPRLSRSSSSPRRAASSKSRTCCCNGDLPTSKQLDEFTHSIRHHTMINESLLRFFNGFHHNAHPMAMVSARGRLDVGVLSRHDGHP